eukprot:19687-Heterococcus_DN1.PRE.1
MPNVIQQLKACVTVCHQCIYSHNVNADLSIDDDGLILVLCAVQFFTLASALSHCNAQGGHNLNECKS